MTKTITDLQPLIYGSMLARREKRRTQRGRMLQVARLLVLPMIYVAIALQITVATGIPPWNWRFLIMFSPVFLIGEQLFIELARGWAK